MNITVFPVILNVNHYPGAVAARIELDIGAVFNLFTFIRVDSGDVCFVSIHTLEFIFTVLTGPAKFYRVVFAVMSKLTLHFEPFAANIAYEGMTSCVRKFMLPQERRRPELFTASLQEDHQYNPSSILTLFNSAY